MLILDHFPTDLTPRDGQARVLKRLAASWKDYDVFVITMPTAAGKSHVGLTIARWSGNASIIVPNNLLLGQYQHSAPTLPFLKKRKSYWCAKCDQSCEKTHAKTGKTCGGSCPYEKAVERACKSSINICNYYTYLSHKPYREVLIIDEAHLALEMLKDLARKKLWQHDYGYPADARSLGDLLGWVEGLETKGLTLDPKLTKLKAELLALEPSTLVRRGRALWRGDERDLVELLPLSVSHEPPVLWPPHRVRKIVLMSATIGRPDVEAMGLDKRRVLYLECASPIPPERRQIHYVPAGNMSVRYQDETLPKLAQSLERIAAAHLGKGLIHAPYSVAEKLRGLLTDRRFVFHTRDNKKEMYDGFLDSATGSEGKILVGSGMYEGLDLKYEAGTWQVITKVPYLSLGDPALRWLAENKPDAYAWQAIRTMMQASGRICRAPDDFGVTFIVDSAFKTLYSKHSNLFANWWKEGYGG